MLGVSRYLSFLFDVSNQDETFGSGCAASTPDGIAQMRIACAAAAESPQIRNIGELFERQNDFIRACEMILRGCDSGRSA